MTGPKDGDGKRPAWARFTGLSASRASALRKTLSVIAAKGQCPPSLLDSLKREGLVGGTPTQCSLTAKGRHLLWALNQPAARQKPEKAQEAIRLPDVLDRLAHPRKGETALLDAADLAAARRFQTDLAKAGLQQRVTQSWSLTSIMHSGRSGGSPSHHEPVAMLDARDRVRKACRTVGPELARVLLDICLKEKPLASVETEAAWPKRSAKVVVMLALRALARHYGLTPAA